MSGSMAYILNPVGLEKACRNSLNFTISLDTNLGHFHCVCTKQNAKDIFIREDRKYVRLDFDDILFFENVGDYVRVKTATTSHIIHGTLRGIAERLEDPRFLKVHRSYIVNLQKIKDIEENTLVIEKTVIPISRAHKPILMSKLNLL